MVDAITKEKIGRCDLGDGTGDRSSYASKRGSGLKNKVGHNGASLYLGCPHQGGSKIPKGPIGTRNFESLEISAAL